MTSEKGLNVISKDENFGFTFSLVSKGLHSHQNEERNRNERALKIKKFREEAKHKCLICFKEFTTKGNLKAHYHGVHDDIQAFKCMYEGCNKGYLYECRLKVHERTHELKKPFICNFCNKCFNEKGNLKTHSRIHTGEKPYKCSFGSCVAAFKASGQLNDHLNVHLKIKPFECKICNKICRVKLHMKEKLKTKKVFSDLKICNQRDPDAEVLNKREDKNNVQFKFNTNNLNEYSNKYKIESFSNTTLINSNVSHQQGESHFKLPEMSENTNSEKFSSLIDDKEYKNTFFMIYSFTENGVFENNYNDNIDYSHFFNYK